MSKHQTCTLFWALAPRPVRHSRWTRITIRGAMEYPDDYTRTLELLARWDLSPMISHRFPLDRFSEALETARDPGVAAKVLIELGEAR